MTYKAILKKWWPTASKQCRWPQTANNSLVDSPHTLYQPFCFLREKNIHSHFQVAQTPIFGAVNQCLRMSNFDIIGQIMTFLTRWFNSLTGCTVAMYLCNSTTCLERGAFAEMALYHITHSVTCWCALLLGKQSFSWKYKKKKLCILTLFLIVKGHNFTWMDNNSG